MPYIRSVPLRRNIRRSICSSTKTSCSTKTPARKSCVKKIVFYRRYRLSLPSLNDRPDDVLYLFSYFLQSFRHRQVSLPKILKKALIQHDWWGNIRELHSVTLRYYIFGDTLNGAYDSLFDIPDENRKESLLDTASLQLDMKHLEKTIQQILIGELQEKGYSQKDIAKLLNVSRQTIFNKLHR